MLKKRLITGILLIASLLLIAFALPPLGILLVLALVSALGQLEFYGMMNRAGIPVFRFMGLTCGTLLILGTGLIMGPLAGLGISPARWEQVVLVTGLTAILLRQFPQKHNLQPLQTIGCSLLGLWYVPYLFNYFTRLVMIDEQVWTLAPLGSTGRTLGLYILLVVKSGDMGAYFTGSRWGKRRLFPRISPNKTWEGFIGGTVASVSSSVLFKLAIGGQFGRFLLSTGDAVVLGLLLSCAGVLGDLFESLVKRASRVKDSGGIIPGMGGILDIVDSLLFGLPLLYGYVLLFAGTR
jgi:phosphatidate cytidylyltransferase